MRFLVTSMQSDPAPPEMAIAMFEGLLQWVSALKETGKLEQSWSFAGLKGGGTILNVDSLEELDSIMGGFPLSPVTEIQVYGLADLENGVNGVLSALREVVG